MEGKGGLITGKNGEVAWRIVISSDLEYCWIQLQIWRGMWLMSAVCRHLYWCWVKGAWSRFSNHQSFLLHLLLQKFTSCLIPYKHKCFDSVILHYEFKHSAILHWIIYLTRPLCNHLQHNSTHTHAVGLSYSDLWTSVWLRASLFLPKMDGSYSSNLTLTWENDTQFFLCSFIINQILQASTNIPI